MVVIYAGPALINDVFRAAISYFQVAVITFFPSNPNWLLIRPAVFDSDAKSPLEVAVFIWQTLTYAILSMLEVVRLTFTSIAFVGP